MFGTIRKHQTWLWACIITITIISFVFFFSPYAKMNSNTRGPANLGSINGERVAEEDFSKAYREIQLRYFFMSNGSWPNEEARQRGFDTQRETYQWLLLIQKEEQLGIHIAPEVVAQAAKNMLSQFQRSGISSPEVFLKQVLGPRNIGLEDFERFVRHYLGIQEIIATVGLSGKLVTPQEAQAVYVREHEELATEVVFLSASNYLAGITATPEAISQYYTNHQPEYRVPDRVQVSYVRFELTNFAAEANAELAKMTNLDAQIDEAYRQNGTNLLREMKAATLEEAKVKIRDAKRKDFEIQSARKLANTFASTLFEMTPVAPENFDHLAKSNNLPVQLSAPFDRETGPKDLGVGSTFARAAFLLTPSSDPSERFGGPIAGDDGVYVIAYNKQIPSTIPPLDQVRDQVTADYKYNQALTMARMAGSVLYGTLTNGLATGKTFAAICLESKTRPVPLSPFSLSTRSIPELETHLAPDQFKQIAFSTTPGTVSQFRPTPDGGLIAYVKQKLPMDDVKMKADMPNFLASLRSARQNEAFNMWFRKEAEKGLRDIPQTPPTPTMSSRAGKAT